MEWQAPQPKYEISAAPRETLPIGREPSCAGCCEPAKGVGDEQHSSPAKTIARLRPTEFPPTVMGCETQHACWWRSRPERNGGCGGRVPEAQVPVATAQ